MEAELLVMVFLNGLPRYVPMTVESLYALRGALGVRRCELFARKPPCTEPGRLPLVPIPIVAYDFDVLRGRPWVFLDNERYVTLDYWARGDEPEPSAEEEAHPWERPPGWWKGSV